MFTLMKRMRMPSKGPQPSWRLPSLLTRRTQTGFSAELPSLVRCVEGSQLLELALSLPILLVLGIGIVDFANAWNIKQKLANAAREGVRIGASALTLEYYSSIGCSLPVASSPCSVQAIADSVKKYMVNAGLNDASCITSNSPSSSTATTWTYTCGGVSMSITWPYSFTASSGAQLMATQVSLTYPYTWSLNHIIGILPGGGRLSLPSTISTSAVMANLN
jgi:Flp pilus assembly protein TadG